MKVHGGQPDIERASIRRRWEYAAGLTDERPLAGDTRGERPKKERAPRKHPADMTFNSLVDRFYDAGPGRNWVFPVDMDALGFLRRWGGLTKVEREARGM